MTYEQFSAWPLLLTREEVRQATGLNDDTITGLVGAGTLHLSRRKGSRKGKFYKWEVATFCGVQLDTAGRVVGVVAGRADCPTLPVIARHSRSATGHGGAAAVHPS